MSDFGQKIRRIRKSLGMTQQEFADALGYAHKSTINKIESGQEDMSFQKLLTLVNKFSLDAQDLFEVPDEVWDQIDKATGQKRLPQHEDCLIYIHGLYGSSLEAELYAPSTNDIDIIGLDYDDGDPWIVKDQIIERFKDIASRYKGVYVLANSIGAFYCYRYLSSFDIKKAFFISPLVNMKQVIEKLMRKHHISLTRLEEEKIIQLDNGQSLSYDFYMSLNIPDSWDVKTYILYGEKDKLVNQESLIHFLANHDATLKVIRNASHYFYTPGQNRCVKKWVYENLYKQ